MMTAWLAKLDWMAYKQLDCPTCKQQDCLACKQLGMAIGSSTVMTPSNVQASRGAVTFHVRRRPQEGSGPRRRKKKVGVASLVYADICHCHNCHCHYRVLPAIDMLTPQSVQASVESLPFLVELTPEGGESRVARLQLSVTEVSNVIKRTCSMLHAPCSMLNCVLNSQTIDFPF